MSHITRKIKDKVNFIVGTIRNVFRFKKTEIVFASPRFKVIRDYTRRAIDGTFASNVLEVYFCGKTENWEQFANIYTVPESWPDAGKWTFNQEGDCASCGWHALLGEHAVEDGDIADALDGDGILRLGCLSKNDEDRGSHRGVKIYIRPNI